MADTSAKRLAEIRETLEQQRGAEYEGYAPQDVRDLLAMADERDAEIAALKQRNQKPPHVLRVVWTCGQGVGHEHDTREDAQDCIDRERKRLERLWP